MKKGYNLSNLCLATIGGIHIMKHKATKGFMKYAAEMGSCSVIYIISFITTDSSIKKLMGEGFTYRQHGDRISYFRKAE
jgi:hypothetical protein